MKHLLRLLALIPFLMLLSLNSISQNLVVNGNVEAWSNSTTPDGWDKIENVFQETTTVYEGTYSVRHVSQSSTTDFSQDVEGIVAGNNYTISYWYYDNDPAARYRIWSYWLSGGQTIDDNGEILRPSEYSTDNPEWLKWEAGLVAPAAADGFRLEVRVYKENDNTGGAVFYDDFRIETSGVNPEPSNFPENFTATAVALNIELSWDDATGEQLPSGYLILGSDSDDIENPVDGTPVPDDENLADGSGALNVGQGVEMAEFKNLQSQSTYYFKIFPYSNGGPNIDYKTDGDPPASNATTANLSIIESIDFNNGFEDWTLHDVAGPQGWGNNNNFGPDGSPCAVMSGYEGQPIVNEDWLISPPMNLDQHQDEVLEFASARNFAGPELEILISNDYSGTGDPNSASWTALDAELSASGWEWTPSGVIDLSQIGGEAAYLAFKYTSTASAAASWEIDNVLITGVAQTGISNRDKTNGISVYPNPASSTLVIDGGDGHYTYRLMTLDGRAVISGEGSGTTRISLSRASQGFYILDVARENEYRYADKILITR